MARSLALAAGAGCILIVIALLISIFTTGLFAVDGVEDDGTKVVYEYGFFTVCHQRSRVCASIASDCTVSGRSSSSAPFDSFGIGVLKNGCPVWNWSRWLLVYGAVTLAIAAGFIIAYATFELRKTSFLITGLILHLNTGVCVFISSSLVVTEYTSVSWSYSFVMLIAVLVSCGFNSGLLFAEFKPVKSRFYKNNNRDSDEEGEGADSESVREPLVGTTRIPAHSRLIK